MERFFVQHMDTTVGRSGVNPTGYFRTLDDAKARCDAVYRSGEGIRQEIKDTGTNETWWRADGDSSWHYQPEG